MKNKTLKIASVLLVSFAALTSTLLAKENINGVVKENGVAYMAPESEAKVTCYIEAGEEFVIVEEIDEYYGVLLGEDEVVYIEKEYIQKNGVENIEEKEVKESIEEKENIEVKEEIVEQDVKEEIVREEKAPASSKGEEIVSYAKQFIGTPYRSGGTDLRSGVDCSGYTTAIFKHFGVSLQRSSRDQYASNGKNVSRGDLKAGDLVFYGYSGSVNHVAIYIGNDKVIHATVPGSDVKISPMVQRGMAPIIGYKRVI